MQPCQSAMEDKQVLETIYGYLNFSSGAEDPKFLASLNELWRQLAPGPGKFATWREVEDHLRHRLPPFCQASPAFEDPHQVHCVLELVFDHALPGYLEFHQDLLFHQDPDKLFGPFFLGRVCEAVLRQGGPWDEIDRICPAAITHLNDFVGYRPLAVLEGRRLEPYPHERVRPVPLFIRDAGVAVGPYRKIIDHALTLLRDTDEDLLRAAHFDPELLDELAYDPRAYDFDHPAHKRPNHHFGFWDPDHLDQQARYRRFVVQQVTLDALLARLDEVKDIPYDELLLEAAAVLAGTMLMGSGVSGSGPDTHDSNVTLAHLVHHIADYRDAFYERLLERLPAGHARRLREEAVERRQPLGAARQHLNAQLARRRAAQLEHVHLAKIFARMGYPEAAESEANVVPVASARMICRIECLLSKARHHLNDGATDEALRVMHEIRDLMRRGIECGAIVDPWNILGFDAQFSLFPAVENSIHDHRVEELVDLMERSFDLYARLWSHAAAHDDHERCEQIRNAFREVTQWWRQFAAHEVSQIEAIDAENAYEAGEHVARALNLWHKEGAETGAVRFWASHADMFDSPQAYALVIDALLDHGDVVAAMGLLIRWLDEGERIPLQQGDSSYFRLAERWFDAVCRRDHADGACPSTPVRLDGATWQRLRKFFDYVEANAGIYWAVPEWELGKRSSAAPAPAAEDLLAEDNDDRSPDDDDLFQAAYENVVYHDSTDDGVDGTLYEGGAATNDELMWEAERISQRLAFHGTLARLWRLAAISPLSKDVSDQPMIEDRLQCLQSWAEQARRNSEALLKLLDDARRYEIGRPMTDPESMIEYDRQRVMQESILEQVMATCVEVADAQRVLEAAAQAEREPGHPGESPADVDQLDEEQLVVRLLAAALRNDETSLRSLFESWLDQLADRPLLYIPLPKGGSPRTIVQTRIRQRCLQDMLRLLPRLGLLTEACQLLETARHMERDNPVGPGAVTEFDELFKIGWSAVIDELVTCAGHWASDSESAEGDDEDDGSVRLLIECLEKLTELLLHGWLSHSRTLRLSVLEKVNDQRSWNRLVKFIQTYGGDLFTQAFLSLGNIRAILHQGPAKWLAQLRDEGPTEMQVRLLDELDQEIPLAEAADLLGLVLEAIVENYGEYRDYNSTTTQSDRGELLYMLLDFLRLRANYDRICWNLRPIVLAHQILVRRGRKKAAQQWRRSLRERMQDEAGKYRRRLRNLQKKYAMQMPSIADRIREGFLRPMIIDRIRALVAPAVAEASRPGAHPTFRLLQYETQFLTKEPSGVGFDMPAWLLALDEEVRQVCQPSYLQREPGEDLCAAVFPVIRSYDEVQVQIQELAGRD